MCCQDDLEETRDAFIHKYSEEPKRDDLTLLAPKQEDPTEQVISQHLLSILPAVSMLHLQRCAHH